MLTAIEQRMFAALPSARSRSRPAVSGYRVGAVALGASGKFYEGGNFEFPGQPVTFSIHAEQAACSAAYMAGEEQLVALAVTDAPCGHCRQFLKELSPDGSLQILIPGMAPTTLESLLPRAFGPSDLGRSQGAFPISPVKWRQPGECGEASARDAAARSYAPYTGAYAGISLKLSNGEHYAGCYIENAAFNPGLPPLQSAIVSLVNAGHETEEICEALLVEAEGAMVSHRSATQLLLTSLGVTSPLRFIAVRFDGNESG